jgi:hypothetical protein
MLTKLWDTLRTPNSNKYNTSYISGGRLTTLSLGQITFRSTSTPASTFVLTPKALDAYEILDRGAEIDENTDNCAVLGQACADGTPVQCVRGKCVVGSLEKQSATLYKYTHHNLAVSYSAADEIKLPNGRKFLEFCELDGGYEDIARAIVSISYSSRVNSQEAGILSNLESSVYTKDLYYGAMTYLHKRSASLLWRRYAREQLKLLDYTQSGTVVLNEIVELFLYWQNCILEVVRNKYNRSSLMLAPRAHPIYARLPQVYKIEDESLFLQDLSKRTELDGKTLDVGFKVIGETEAYIYLPRSITDPETRDLYDLSPLDLSEQFTPKDPQSWVKLKEYDEVLDVSKLTLAGIDGELTASKEKIGAFFTDILDPDTCYPQVLDWVASIVGLLPPIWNAEWDLVLKRAVIKNALGWYDRLTSSKNLLGEDILTPKGETLNQYPFSEYPQHFGTSNNLNYEFSSLVPQIRVKNSMGITSLVSVDRLALNKADWVGLYESKGTFYNLFWWLMALRARKFDASTEIEDDHINIFVENESEDACTPIVLTPCQVGDADSAFDNKAVCGISRLYERISVVVPMSFKYSRDGAMWANVNDIVENWTRIDRKPRVQYALFAAGYSTADDFLFEMPA